MILNGWCSDCAVAYATLQTACNDFVCDSDCSGVYCGGVCDDAIQSFKSACDGDPNFGAGIASVEQIESSWCSACALAHSNLHTACNQFACDEVFTCSDFYCAGACDDAITTFRDECTGDPQYGGGMGNLDTLVSTWCNDCAVGWGTVQTACSGLSCQSSECQSLYCSTGACNTALVDFRDRCNPAAAGAQYTAPIAGVSTILDALCGAPTAAAPTAAAPTSMSCGSLKQQFEDANCGTCGQPPGFTVGGSTCRGLKQLYKLGCSHNCPTPVRHVS
jgi:hypothetical protein